MLRSATTGQCQVEVVAGVTYDSFLCGLFPPVQRPSVLWPQVEAIPSAPASWWRVWLGGDHVQRVPLDTLATNGSIGNYL